MVFISVCVWERERERESQREKRGEIPWGRLAEHRNSWDGETVLICDDGQATMGQRRVTTAGDKRRRRASEGRRLDKERRRSRSELRLRAMAVPPWVWFALGLGFLFCSVFCFSFALYLVSFFFLINASVLQCWVMGFDLFLLCLE